MTEEELREALRVHGFSSLNEFLDLRDEVNKTSGEIKYKLLREEHENEAESEKKSEEEDTEKEEIYCTECPYFEDIVDDARSWYGGLCKKDGHKSSPSMYAIQILNDDCPLKKEGENK